MGIFDYLYSKKAIDQLNATTPIRGKDANQPYSCFILRCPYHAKVIKTLDTMSNNIV